MVYWLTGAILLAYLILTWFIGTWVNPPGSGIWVLRGGLALLGIIAAGISVWWFRQKALERQGSEPAGSQVGDEIDLLVREAVRKIKNSPLGRGANLGNLPVVFLVGETGSTKTTTMIHSALDPELLAGQVYRDRDILPTNLVNFWYTRQAVFVDTAGALVSQPDRWKRLVKLVQPSRVGGMFGNSQQAARAAIVCFDCETFVKPGATEAVVSAARKLGSRLIEISQMLGISFPIYTLFTRADRIGARTDGSSFFLDYVSGLNKDEASQVFGATLPLRPQQSTGVYAEEETRRLGKAFDELFYSLAEKRLQLLAVSNQFEKLPGIYEFPRELRKIRNLVVQFLVDVARPSQLNVNPFLRGFYFSGVRPLVIEDVAPAQDLYAAESSFDAGATVVFSAASLRAPQAPQSPRGGTRKVPQWIFLSQFFNDVLLKDRVALSASKVSSKVNLLRRILFASLAAIALVCAIGFMVSFIGNRSLENQTSQSEEEVRGLQLAANQTPSLDQLQKLDRLRQELATIVYYRRDGVPLHLRWGLYVGDDLYPQARRIYFDGFRNLLFADAQGKVLNALRTVKAKPDPTDNYETTYNDLKAYLITTEYPQNRSREFLPPVLYNRWVTGKGLDEPSATLANAQFDFYSTELLAGNPYSSNNDSGAIGRARAYLGNFGGIDRYYLPLKASASRKFPAASFGKQFRDAADLIYSPHEVEGAFTRDGFKFMQDAITHPSRIASEEWVLGKTAASQLDQATLQQQLSERYYGDFAKEWRTVLQTSQVRGYGNFHDADAKLGKLVSPSSPLLELFWFVSQNTDVGMPDITDSFQPVQSVVPPGPADKYILPSNDAYVSGLTGLKSALSLLAVNATDPNAGNQALSAGLDADKSVGQLAQKFRVDPQFHIEAVTQALLEQPIRHADALIKGSSKGPLNEAGKAFCSQYAQVAGKFPFNPSSTEDLQIDRLNSIFAPNTGQLWAFYNTSLSKFLVKTGTRYDPVSSGSVKISPDFANFFNRAAALSEGLYANGSATPHFAYSLKQLPSNVDGLSLKIGNDTLTSMGQQKSFSWTGVNEEVEAKARGNLLGSPYSGPWAIFHFVSDARWKTVGPGSYDLEWVMQSNGRDIILPNGKKESYTYELLVNGFNPLHSPEISGLRCVSQVAR